MLRRLAIALAATALLAGCTDGEPSVEPTPKMPSTSPTTEPTPDGPVEPTPPPEMEGDDAAAAEAFVEYYFAHWDYAIVNGETSTLESIAFPTCGPCAGVAGAIADTYANGGSIEGGVHNVKSVRLGENTGIEGQRIYAGTAAVEVSAQTIQDSGLDGLDGDYPAGSDNYQLVVIHDKRGWHMSEWKTQ